jgi:hypothetical protein
MVRHVITQMEDAMPPLTQHPEFQGWQRLAGTWAAEATHPALAGTVVTGQARFEWLEEQRFLIQRSHCDHPEIPDAIAVTAIIDGKPSMHSFDSRGVHRVLAVDITADTGRFWNDAPGFSQRCAGNAPPGPPVVPAASLGQAVLCAARRPVAGTFMGARRDAGRERGTAGPGGSR